MFLPSEILEKLINVIRVLQLHTTSLVMMTSIRFQEMKLMHTKAYGYTLASLIILVIYFLRKAILILNKRYASVQTGFSLEQLLASTQKSYLDRINY